MFYSMCLLAVSGLQGIVEKCTDVIFSVSGLVSTQDLYDPDMINYQV